MSTEETPNRIAPELKWAAGLLPPLVIALFTADAYLRRATIALAIQTPPDILGEVVGPPAWTAGPVIDVGVLLIVLLLGFAINERGFRTFVAITSVVLACVAIILEKFIASEWVFRVLSVAGIAAGLGLGQCIRALVYGRLPAWWLPIASGLFLIVLLGMTGSAQAGTAKSINTEMLDRTFPKVVMFDFEDALDELEVDLGKEATSVYYLGSNGSHTYFLKIQDGTWSTQIVRDSDIKTIRFRSLHF